MDNGTQDDDNGGMETEYGIGKRNRGMCLLWRNSRGDGEGDSAG